MARSGAVEEADLYAAGLLGVVESRRGFREDAGVPFERWAMTRARGAMRDELRSRDPLTRSQRALQRRFARAAAELRADGAEPGVDAVSARMGVAREALERHRAVVHRATRHEALDAVEERVGDEAQDDPESSASRRELWQVALEGLDTLPPRLRLVIDRYYRDERTLAAIGDELGLTEARVCQLHGDAIRLLRRRCERAAGLSRLASARRRDECA